MRYAQPILNVSFLTEIENKMDFLIKYSAIYAVSWTNMNQYL